MSKSSIQRRREYTLLTFAFVISVLGVFPWHLLSAFPLVGALRLTAVDLRVRWLVGAVSAGILILGLLSALAS